MFEIWIQIKLFPAGCPAREPSDGSFNLFYFLAFLVDAGKLCLWVPYWEWNRGEFTLGLNDPVIREGNLLKVDSPLADPAPLTLRLFFFPRTIGRLPLVPSLMLVVAYMLTFRLAAVGWMLFWWRIVKFSTSLCLFCLSCFTSLSLLIFARFN